MGFRARAGAVPARVRLILAALARVPTAGAVLVAIDGRAGSGKTTLANELIGWEPRLRLFHADELQRPQAEGEWETWTPGECAANFANEAPLRAVVSSLAAGRQARYEPYDWSAHQVGSLTTLSPGGVMVVEGAYTMQQSLREYYDLTIWVDCQEEARAARLRARPAPSPGWLEAWTKGEEFYLQHEQPSRAADVVIAGTDQ